MLIKEAKKYEVKMIVSRVSVHTCEDSRSQLMQMKIFQSILFHSKQYNELQVTRFNCIFKIFLANSFSIQDHPYRRHVFALPKKGALQDGTSVCQNVTQKYQSHIKPVMRIHALY